MQKFQRHDSFCFHTHNRSILLLYFQHSSVLYKDTVFITSIVRLWGWPVRIFGSLLSFSPFKIPCKIKTSKTCQIIFWMPSSERSLSPSQYIASSIRKASRWISWGWFSISARYPPWLQQNYNIMKVFISSFHFITSWAEYQLMRECEVV